MLSLTFLEDSAEIYGDDVMKPVCPSVTRWTAHERACLAFFKSFSHILNTLIVSYREREESEALGLIIHASSSQMIATILMLLEIFQCIRPLILSLQKSLESLCISEVKTYVENLETKSIFREYFTEEVFNNFKSIWEEQISALPSSTRLRKETFDFKKFDSEVYIWEEIKDAFSGIDFWTCFPIFDPESYQRKVCRYYHME